MPKVRTARRHGNAYPPQYEKNPGRIYDVPEGAERSLISNGLVELVADKPVPADNEVSQAGNSE